MRPRWIFFTLQRDERLLTPKTQKTGERKEEILITQLPGKI
jgi:hypothetical protein